MIFPSCFDSTSCADKGGDKSSHAATCLKSLCIYCPSLSEGKAERAMDNILFFYPPHIHRNERMNHVGFCIGITCILERFGHTDSLEEIRTSSGSILLCSPVPNLWIAVETATSYRSSSLMPVIRRGFDVFVLRNDWRTVSALLMPVGRSVTSEGGEARVRLKRFYDKFAFFLEMHVAVSGGGGVGKRSSALQSSSSSPLSSATTLGGEGCCTGILRWKQHWSAVAASEGLLGFPVTMIQSPSPAMQSTCQSLVHRYLSFLSTAVGEGGDNIRGNSNNNMKGNNKSGGGGGGGGFLFSGSNSRTSCMVGWGDEYRGIITNSPSSTSAMMKTAEERLLWTCCQYVVFEEEALSVIAFNASPEFVSRLLCLLLIEPDVTHFTAFTENDENSHCYVCRESGVIVAILVNSEIYSCMHDAIVEVCMVLTRDIAEYLTKGACTLIRKSSVNPREMQQLAMNPLNLSYQNASKFFSTIMQPLQKLREMKLTFQWTVLLCHSGIMMGSSMREYPSQLRKLLSNIFRVVINGGDRGCLPYSVEDMKRSSDVSCCTSTPRADVNNISEVGIGGEGGDRALSTYMQESPAVVEMWLPIQDKIWICVSRSHHHLHHCQHVAAIVFYNSPSLRTCIDAASKLLDSMPFLV